MLKYNEWVEAHADLQRAKKLELSLRNEICSELLVDKLEGSKTVREDGFIVTTTAKLIRSINREVLESVWSDLSDREKECVVYKPSLVLSNYKVIEAEGGILMEAITVKPGQSALKIIPEDLA